MLSRPSPVRFEIACTGTPYAIVLDLCHRRLRCGVEVALREHDDGLGAALPGEGQVPLQPAQVEILVQRRDAGRPRRRWPRAPVPPPLARPSCARTSSGGAAPPGSSRLPHRFGRRPGDPVADDRQLGRRRCLVDEAPGDIAAELAGRGEDVVGAAMLHGDPAGNEPLGGVGLELLAQPVVSSRASEVQASGLPLGLGFMQAARRICTPAGVARRECGSGARTSRRAVRRAVRR